MSVNKKRYKCIPKYYNVVLICSHRGMALCFVMMSGRIGAVVGSNMVGALLNGRCDWIFWIFTAFLMGNY